MEQKFITFVIEIQIVIEVLFLIEITFAFVIKITFVYVIEITLVFVIEITVVMEIKLFSCKTSLKDYIVLKCYSFALNSRFQTVFVSKHKDYI